MINNSVLAKRVPCFAPSWLEQEEEQLSWLGKMNTFLQNLMFKIEYFVVARPNEVVLSFLKNLSWGALQNR